MASMAQLRCSPLSHHHFSRLFPTPSDNNSSVSFLSSRHCNFPPRFVNPLFSSSTFQLSAGNGSDGGRGGGGGVGHSNFDSNSDSSSSSPLGLLGFLVKGWQSRVYADPQFPFKVLMEELVGVSAAVLGDMATRPNFGLNELDFVFSTLIVGSILNFVLMYLLAPTAVSSSSSTLPSIFAGCPTSHMFEPGAFGLVDRFGTLVYKGLLFAGVGFAAGLVGTGISNGLIKLRKSMDPYFDTPNRPPPTLLNATTWALHMGISSNLRYQTLNGIEFLLETSSPSSVFKASVFALRLANNVLGGMTFVMLARLTGSQAKPIDDNLKLKTKSAYLDHQDQNQSP